MASSVAPPPASPPQASLKDVMKFFDIPTKEFTREWRALTDADREQIRQGIHNGTLTY